VHWSSLTREDAGTWRENSLYRTRSLLVDRAVQSELTTKSVAENCLAVTADAVNGLRSEEEPTPSINICQGGAVVVVEDEQNVVVEEWRHVDDAVPPVSALRRDSYQQAIMNATQSDNSTCQKPADLEKDDQTLLEVLETVSEMEEADIDDALKAPEKMTAEDDELMQSTEANVDEIVKCQKEAERTEVLIMPDRAQVWFKLTFGYNAGG